MYHVFSSFLPQASLSFMLVPLLSKKWPIFAKSYYYRSMRDPMYGESNKNGAVLHCFSYIGTGTIALCLLNAIDFTTYLSTEHAQPN